MAGRTALGGLLRRWRMAVGLTQEQLAERAGVSARAVSDLERGVHARARRSTLDRLAVGLGLTPAQQEELLAASSDGALLRVPLPPGTDALPAASFVGRVEARRVLREIWQYVAAGRTRAVLIAGEPGIGKSALAGVTARELHEEGAVVLFGRCEQHASDPYRPFVEALRTLARSIAPDRVRAFAGAQGPLLDVLLPGMGLLPSGRERTAADQLGLFEAVRSFLEGVAANQPCVLMITDLHWADASTLALLRHLARSGSGRLLVLGTARLERDDTCDQLRASVVELRRSGHLDVLELNGLDGEETAELLRGVAGLAPPELVAALRRETGGNPFFTLDVARQLVNADAVRDGRWRRYLEEGLVPSEDVRFVLRRQVDRVAEPVRRLLAIAALVGHSFDVATLAAVAELDPRDALGHLDEAAAAGLVVETGDFENWEFVHGLVRASLAESLSRSSQARVHAAIAERFEAVGLTSDDQVERLATHYWRAIPLPRAAERAAAYARRGAQRAVGMLAWEDAALGFERALHAMDAGGGVDPRARCEVLVSAGEARTEALQRHLARPVFVDAARDALGLDAPELLGRAARGYAYMTKRGQPEPDAVDTWQCALARNPAGDLDTRVMVLCALATAQRLTGDGPGMHASSDEALELARRSAVPDTLVVALANESTALWASPELTRRIELAQELIELARRLGDVDAELDGLALLFLPLLGAGHVAEADRVVDQVDARAGEHHRRLSIAQAMQWHATRHLMRGEVDEACLAASRALDISGGAPNFTAGYYAFQLSLDRLREQPASVDPAVAAFADKEPGLTVWRAAAMSEYCRLGEFDTARRLVGRSDLAIPSELECGDTRLTTLVLLAEVAAAFGDAAAARRLIAQLEPYAGSLVVVASGTSCEGAVDRYLGLLALTLGDDAGGRERLATAAALEHASDAPALAARTERDLDRARARANVSRR